MTLRVARIPLIVGALGLTLVALTRQQQQPQKQQQPAAEEDDSAVPVRYPEGTTHGFLILKTPAGEHLADGDLVQIPRKGGMESTMTFHFDDGSLFVETVVFTQRRVLSMQSYHIVNKGPAFKRELDAMFTRDGAYSVTSHEPGKEVERKTGTLELPPDVYNGMVITVAKNLDAQPGRRVHMVAFTPSPTLIGLELAPSPAGHFRLGRRKSSAVHFTLKPKLGKMMAAFAHLVGKSPPDGHAWILTDGAPAFVRFEGPLAEDRLWRIDLVTPTWP